MDVPKLHGASGGLRGAQSGSKLVTFQVERVADIYLEAADLLIRHHHEVEMYKDLKINPKIGVYLAQENTGTCVIITARCEKKLIGYQVYLLQPNLHYQVLEAVDDIHFLLPDYRKGDVGIRLFRAGEAEMRKRGVKVIVARTKADPRHDHGAIFEYLGYDKCEIVYTKRLDHVV